MTNSNILVKNTFLCFLTAFILFSLDSCARKVTFLTSSVVPAAHGTVKVKKDANDNYGIEVHLLDLAQPSRLPDPKKLYVVWMETNQHVIKNIGQINSSTSLFSKKLKADFHTVSTSKPIKVFVTAEDEANIQNPGMQVVLTTASF